MTHLWSIHYWISILAQLKQNIVVVFTWLWSGIKVTTTICNVILTHFDMSRYFALSSHLLNVTYSTLQLGVLIQMEKPNSFEHRRAEGPEMWRPWLNAFTAMAQKAAHRKRGSAAFTREMERRRLFSPNGRGRSPCGVPLPWRRVNRVSKPASRGRFGEGRSLLPSKQQRFDSTLIWGLG